MTKKEIKAMKNEELIMTLCKSMTGMYIRKGRISDAQKIFVELEARGIIENAESASKEWERFYRM